MPDLLDDPYEPVNRGIWAFNEGLLNTVIHPSSRVYHTVVPQPVRNSITKFGRNIAYPGRLVNHVLQGRWEGAGNETLRFVSNTTVGLGGFFDPSSTWNIEKSDANFNQTFAKWGMKRDNFVMLPVLGPSDHRNVLGRIGDELSEPLNYYKPYSNISYVTAYNEVAGVAGDVSRLIDQENDPYFFTRYGWTYAAKEGLPDLEMTESVDVPTLETLNAIRLRPEDPEFIYEGSETAVRIPATGKKLEFNYWMQPDPAPLVYLTPGLNSHRVSQLSIAMAEQLYRNGFSVVSISSVFHPEFMRNASSAALPVYPPVDSRDLLVAMTEIDRMLMRKHPKLLTKRAFMGFSMGGFMVLQLAAREDDAKAADLMTFDRYVAINMPVDLRHGVEEIDSYINAPLQWPEAERQQMINNTMHKTSYAIIRPQSPEEPVMFGGNESKYLIGLSFRLGLRDIIYDSQSRNNLGVLNTPLSHWNRKASYAEMMSYSYRDYFLKFAVPYYAEKGITLEAMLKEADLRIHEEKLRNQKRVRILTNRNDFLLAEKDLSWLNATFPKSRLTVFPSGGHMGNLNEPDVQKAIIKSLDGLR